MKNIAIIFGGNNSEHEVSLSSSDAVTSVIDNKKYNLIYVAILKNGHWIVGNAAKKYLKDKDDIKLLDRNDITKFVEMVMKQKIDLVLPVLHGEYGEDGRLQGFFDVLGVSYAFSGHSAHALGMDKSKTKKIVQNSGVNVIPGYTIKKNEKFDIDSIVEELKLPLFVKPGNAGSSVGISKVENKDELSGAIKFAFEYGDEVIIEKMIVGRELTVAIIEQNGQENTLPIVEIITNSNDWYDYNAKYESGGSTHVCPAEIPNEIEIKAREYTFKAFSEVGCKHLARVDFLWDNKTDDVYFLEINTIPGMTGTSLVPDAARIAGISFEQLINNLIENNLS
jgi:D-alanine-D-alanine ligase